VDFIFANQDGEDGYGVVPTPFADEIFNELLKRGYHPSDCHFRFEDPALLENDRSSVKRFLNGPVELCNPGRDTLRCSRVLWAHEIPYGLALSNGFTFFVPVRLAARARALLEADPACQIRSWEYPVDPAWFSDELPFRKEPGASR
ncbi:MAG: hypothetical protein KDC95_08630, partial [Planctomycetes bacterium]|nr:hypothetical protein [Planctomycetota bacterium]